jgi:hypothetical protein
LFVLKTLVTFNLSNGTYPDGAAPYASLIADANGDLFGTTTGNLTNGYGTVFEIAIVSLFGTAFRIDSKQHWSTRPS